MRDTIGELIGVIITLSAIIGGLYALDFYVKISNDMTEMIETQDFSNADEIIVETIQNEYGVEAVKSAVYWGLILLACTALGIKIKTR